MPLLVFQAMVNTIVKDGIYRHYKGQQYRAIDIVRHSETLEELVFYECLYENKLGQFWVRPKAMWFEELEIGGKKVRRFELIQTS